MASTEAADHVCTHQHGQKSDAVQKAAAEELTLEAFGSELQDVKANLKHLNSDVRVCSQRVDYLENAHARLMYKHRAASGAEQIVNGVQEPNAIMTVKQIFKSTSYHRVTKALPSSFSNGSVASYLDEWPQEIYRVVGVRKAKGSSETLGLGLREDSGQIIVDSVAEGSAVARLQLLHVGDVLLEINGKPSPKSADEAMQAVRANNEGLLVKIIPSQPNALPHSEFHVKAYFDYNPNDDPLIPSKEIGLPFRGGDILQIISNDDDNWWHARKLYDSSRIGLIPSQVLQESRLPQDSTRKVVNGVSSLASGLSTLKRKLKLPGVVGHEGKGVEHPLIYEEFGRLCPYGRRVLILLGAPGVGRRTLKSRLLRHDPLHFATVIPFTSRSKREGEVEGREYYFRTREEMQQWIDNGELVEWGEFNGNLYGTKLQSIREIVKLGKMCVLDCSPQAIKHLYSWEFMPFIVFVTPPPLEELRALYMSQITNNFKPKTDEELIRTSDYSIKLETAYRAFFDHMLTNRNAEVTFRRLLDALETLKTQQQWIPASWLHI